MELKNRLTNDMKDAMRARDEQRRTTLRMVLSAIKLAEVEKQGELDENSLLALLHKEIKSRRESIADAEKANRADLIVAAQDEIAIIEEYLPKPFTPEELEALARQAIAETGAQSVREMGQVMKVLIPRLEGRASGGEASQTVRKLLS
jgi:uncharacterized protein YqeY